MKDDGTVKFYNAIMCQKDADGMANSVVPDQTAPQEQSDLGLHCLPRPICPNIQNFYGIKFFMK